MMNIEKKANNQNQVSQVVSTPLPHREGQRGGSPVIKLKEINKIYRTDEVETQALENVNLEVRKGEFLSIMGPSGCGKSTLLNIMGLLDEPTSGQIELCGQVIDPKMSDNRLAELRNKTLGFVFQSFHLIPTLNVIGQRAAAAHLPRCAQQRAHPSGQGGHRARRPQPPHEAPPHATLRRTVPARGHRPRHHRQPRNPSGRRAHG